MSAAACFDVLVFDPKTPVPPITAEIAPIIATESNLIAPNVKANSHIPPAAMATFETRITFRQLYDSGKLVDVSFDARYLIAQIIIGHADIAA